MTDFRVNVPIALVGPGGGVISLPLNEGSVQRLRNPGAMYATTHEIEFFAWSWFLLFVWSLIQGNRGHSWFTGSLRTIEEADRFFCYGF